MGLCSWSICGPIASTIRRLESQSTSKVYFQALTSNQLYGVVAASCIARDLLPCDASLIDDRVKFEANLRPNGLEGRVQQRLSISFVCDTLIVPLLFPKSSKPEVEFAKASLEAWCRAR